MLINWSVKKPYSIIVAVTIILVLGITAFLHIRTDLLPDVDYPYAVVVTNYPDASPEEVEETVTRPIEKALAGVGRVTETNSISTQGRSIVTVGFSQATNMDSVVAEMREVFEPLKDGWGRTVSSPSIRKVNPDTMPVIVASIDLEGGDGAEISKFLNETLMTYFDGIEGVADRSVIGLVSEQVQIAIDPEKLAAVNSEIFQAIGGDYAKARAALEATDAELSGASSRLSSDLLNQTAALDSQLRSLNAQLSREQASANAASERVTALRAQVNELQSQRDAYTQRQQQQTVTVDEEGNEVITGGLTPEEEEAAAALDASLASAKAQLSAAEANISNNNSTVSSLNQEISSLQARRDELTRQMGNSESELAESKASITKQLSDLAAAEETAKAEADLSTLITTEMVSTMLAAQNFSSTAGSLALGNREYDVKVGDKIGSIDELQNLVLFHFDLDGVEDVILDDVANVNIVNDSGAVYSRINGHDGVLISFIKQSDYATAEVAENIWATFREIEAAYPSVTITALSDQSVYIDRVSKAVTENLIIGAILAILVLVLFLRDVRPTLVVGIAIPVSLLFALVLMYFSGVTLNIFSLAGLALGVGMLVDNSIVVMENIYRCRSIGMSRGAAAIDGAKQVAAAIVASTLTTICVFLPVVFTNGLSRQLFTDIGLTIAFALLASLLMAFTLVPAMSASVLRRMRPKSLKSGRRVLVVYESLLRWALEHRVFVLLLAFLLLGFSTVFAVSRGSSFLPQTDSTEMTLTVTMEEDVKEEVLWNVTDKIVGLLQDMDDVRAVGAVNDSGGTVSLMGDVSEGGATNVYVVLKDDKRHTCGEIAETLMAETENLGCHIDVSIGSYDLSSLYDDGIQITVRGEDLSTLASITRDMGELLLSVEGAENIKSTMDTATPTLRVSVNKAEAMRYGLTVSDVYDFISLSISNSANATTLDENGADGTDVIVIDGQANDLTLADIQNLKMTVTDDSDGTTSEVVVGSIATITEEEGAPVIYRDDQTRYMTATADVGEKYNVGLVSDEIRQLVEGYEPPEGYTIAVSGEESAIGDAIHDLLIVLSLSLLLMYLIMVAQFQSLRLPFIIMLTVPLAFTGGFVALLISGKDFSIIAVVGFLLLSGIVVNNGIVLVDYMDRLRRSGKGLSASIIEGCRTRLRPILMTATTTVLALVTLAFGLGMGAEVVQPMAIVVFGGMIYATFVTLLVVPVIYDLILRRKSDAAVEDIVGLIRPEEDDGEDRPRRRRFPTREVEKEADEAAAEAADAGTADDDDDEEDDADEDAKGGSFFRRLFHRADGADDDDDDDEIDADDGDVADDGIVDVPVAGGDDDDDDDDEEDDVEDEEDDAETVGRRRRFFPFRRTKDEDLIDDEDEEDEEEDDDEDAEDDGEYAAAPGFFRSFLRLFHRAEEEDDDEEDDEDYYGLRERRERNSENAGEGPVAEKDPEEALDGDVTTAAQQEEENDD